ncbi:MAG: CDGSH iron-sulfur domain-containing protein [Tannerellaceae bacterium]|nr:CDGSH iron-sulfur domain-containing protein [Tannerellaceae bacterium]
MPYCDGSHVNHFDGTETASHKTYDEMAEFIEGKQVDLLDAEDLCAVARFCDTKSGTWNLVRKAENVDAVDIIKHHCEYCPSGRLTMVTKEGERIEPYLMQGISLLDDPEAAEKGPLWVKGGIEIEDAQGKCYPVRNRVTLCCCGKSKNKPFCDSSHM